MASPSRFNGINRAYLTRLALGAGLMALVMAGLVLLQLGQRDEIEADANLRTDSLLTLTFQLEREFLRFRATLEAAALAPSEPDLDALGLRYDIYVSRLNLLRDSPSTAALAQGDQTQPTLARMIALVSQTDQTLAQRPLTHAALQGLLAPYDALGQEVQQLTLTAGSMQAHAVERQKHRLLAQHQRILWLAAAQVLLLAAAALALLAWQRRQQRQMQALTQLSEDLQSAQREAQAAQRVKTHFLANISHELRTPLNGILGMIEVLGGTPLNTQQRSHLGAARQSADRLLVLLNDLLDIVSLDAGDLHVTPAPTHLRGALSELHALYQPLAARKGLSLEWAVDPDLPAHVLTDARRFKQILGNLLGNAIKFTDQGQVRLHVEAAQAASDRMAAVWVFRVSDTGMGMDSTTLSGLFTRFHQADTSRIRHHEGGGLGLALSHRLAQTLGGTLAARSSLGGGSVFTLTLPLPLAPTPVPSAPLSAPNAPAVALDAAPSASSDTPDGKDVAPPSPSSPANQRRVLVVEDNPVNTQLLRVLLDRLNLAYDCVGNGRDAVERARAGGYHVVLMDIHMPVMDGLTATRMIRTLPAPVGQVPILIISADAQADTLKEAKQAGANGFLPKPVQLSAFTAALREHLGLEVDQPAPAPTVSPQRR